MELLKKICKAIIGLVIFAVGVSAIAFPAEAFANLSMVWAIMFLMGGVAAIVAFFAAGKGVPGRGVLLVMGIVQALMGTTLIRSGIWFTQLVAINMCQIWIIFNGVEFLVGSFEEKDAGVSTWWLTLILGILMLMLGLSTVSSVLFSVTFMPIMVGTGMMISGAAFVVNAFMKSKEA